MRLIVFFDLPTLTSVDLKEYRTFRKFLITDGYVMLQESVYFKLVANFHSANLCIERVKKNKPKKGSVFVLSVTEKQFNNMEFISGELNTDTIVSTDKVVFL